MTENFLKNNVVYFQDNHIVKFTIDILITFDLVLEKSLNHCGLVMPYGEINLGQHRLRLWLVAWQHQAIIWTNVDFL